MGKTLLSLPKNRVNYQPLFKKARGKRAFPKKASQYYGGKREEEIYLYSRVQGLSWENYQGSRELYAFQCKEQGNIDFLVWKVISSVYFHY